MPPKNIWLTISSYRGYWDFPRFILAIDEAGNHWILDNRFDDEREDYSDDYTIFQAGTSASEAYDLFDRIGKSQAEPEPVGHHPIRTALFDETRRKQVMLRD